MKEIVYDYHNNGNLRFESEMIDGLPNGLQRHWHRNGVLEMELFFDHGILDGTMRQWNDNGDLLGRCEFVKGTGTHRTWHPNGKLSYEASLIGGRHIGRERMFLEDGKLLQESYFLNNKLSKKRYLAACETDPSLPRYENEPPVQRFRWPKEKRVRRPPPTAGTIDELPLRLLSGPDGKEAAGWLEQGANDVRTLGESMSQKDSLALVKKFYRLGAKAVHAVEIRAEPADYENTGRLVIELPQGGENRKKVLKLCGSLGRKLGFDPDPDVGQRYALVMLD